MIEPNDNQPSVDLPALTSEVAGAVQQIAMGLPDPVSRNLWHSLNRLCTAAMDIPVNYLNGISANIRSATESRVRLQNSAANSMVERLHVPDLYVDIASNTYAKKIAGKQGNVNSAVLIATSELSNKDQQTTASSCKPITDQWLDHFESEAEKMSTPYMQTLFGKILAGEIRRPGSFSIKAIRVLSELDQETAMDFAHCCSMVIKAKKLNNEEEYFYAYLQDSENREWGLSQGSFNNLVEAGLIRILPDAKTFPEYIEHLKKLKEDERNNFSPLEFYLQNKKWSIKLNGSVPEKNIFSERFSFQFLRFGGYMLTKVGRELLSIVQISPNKGFIDQLTLNIEAENFILKSE